MNASAAWLAAIQNSADPARAQHHFDLLSQKITPTILAAASPAKIQIVCAILAGSQALSLWLIAHADVFALFDPERLQHSRRKQGLEKEINEWLPRAVLLQDFSSALEKLRFFKQKELLRIAARDLARLANAAEIVLELSDLADVVLSAVLSLCAAQVAARFGNPWHLDAAGKWQKTGFCVLGLGKLGGQELNYSSDVDVIFVYADEGIVSKTKPVGKTAPQNKSSNHHFFNRLAELFIAEVSRLGAEGMLYRIDLRLRPEGDSGPLTRSVASYENFYSQWGQTWERMMLIKARCVAGDRLVAADFLETIQSFRFPRYLAGGVLGEIAAIKKRIEAEVVKAGELESNVKLGRGGIREIEFIAQSLQLLHAGKMPFLQNRQTISTLEKLAQYDLLPGQEARALTHAYYFLRDIEHRLQMNDNRQTHSIPANSVARMRLARLMNFSTVAAFETELRRQTALVRRIYQRLLPGKTVEISFPPDLAANNGEWRKILGRHGFRDLDLSLRLLAEFVQGPGFAHVSRRTEELAWKLVPRLLAVCPNIDAKSRKTPARILSDPDRVLNRLDGFITAYGARATLFEIWNSNPSLFELLLWLFDRSEFLAEIAVRAPDLVDELVSSERLRQSKTAAETLQDLRHGKNDADQLLWLRQYHQAELMRIALRDILGLADVAQNVAELSALAEASLQYALEIALKKQKVPGAPITILACGKLGGREIGYGSDLDILFVAQASAAQLPKLQSVAGEVLRLLSERTAHGIVFATDARLRPDGEKGLLVNTLAAYQSYYLRRAQLWELQALSRVRGVAGNEKLGSEFVALAAELTDFRNPVKNSNPVITPDWRKKIHEMRLRIERERTPPGQDDLAIKTGAGGLMDAEFLAQTFCLAHGWHEPNTLSALLRATAADVWKKTDAAKFIAAYRELRQVEGVLRRWSFAGETILPAEPEPFYRVAVRCGYFDAEQFRRKLKNWRQTLRAVYNKQSWQ